MKLLEKRKEVEEEAKEKTNKGSISPTFSRAFFARVLCTNVFFLVTYKKRARKTRAKTLVKSTQGENFFRLWRVT